MSILVKSVPAQSQDLDFTYLVVSESSGHYKFCPISQRGKLQKKKKTVDEKKERE